MEKRVLEIDFLNATFETRSDLDKWFQRNYDFLYYEVSADDLMGALRVLRHVTCRPDYPCETSYSGYVAKDVLEKIIDIIKEQDENGRLPSKIQFLDFCFDYLIDLLGCGPGTTQMLMWKVMLGDQSFGFKQYYNSLSRERLIKLICAMKREWKSSEPDLDVRRYSIEMESALRFLLDRNTPSDKALSEAHEEFLDLYIYNEIHFLGCKDEIIRRQHFISSTLYHRYNRKPFVGIDDPAVFRKHLQEFQEIICTEEFPRDKHEADTMEDLLTYFMAGISHNLTLFPLLHLDIIDFMSTVCERKAWYKNEVERTKTPRTVGVTESRPVHLIIEMIGNSIYHFTDPADKPVFKDNTELFESLSKKMIVFLDNLKDWTFVRKRFVLSIVRNILCKSMNGSADHVTLFIDLIKSCLRISEAGCAEAAYRGIREQKEILKWKGRIADANEILDILSQVKITGETEKEKTKMSEHYVNFVEYFLNQCTRDRILADINTKIMEFSLRCLDLKDPFFFSVGEKAADFVQFNAKKNKDAVMSLFKHFHKLLLDDQYPWDISSCRLTNTLTTKASRTLKDCKSLDQNELGILMSLLQITIQNDFILPLKNAPGTVFFQIFSHAGPNIIQLLDDEDKISRFEGLIKDLTECVTDEYKEVVEIASSMVAMVASQGPKYFAPYLDKLINVYLDEDVTVLLSAIIQIYPYSPRSVSPHFQTFFEMIKEPHTAITILIWLPEIAKRQPDLFTDDNIGTLVEEMFSGSYVNHSQYLSVLDVLAKKRPHRVAKHLDSLLHGQIHPEYGLYQMAIILKHIAVNSDESTAERVMEYYEKELKEPDDQMMKYLVLNEMRAVGLVHRHLLEKHKSTMINLKQTTHNQSLQDACTHIIDVLEGRSLMALSEDIKDVKDDVEELDERVTVNKENISEVSAEVKKQKIDVDIVKDDVKQQGQKLVDLQETVEETVVKVEEIDSKTLSHAPFWSRDISKLLNPHSEHDWHLLSSRLGYSNDDIRAWSQQADPCMAMLNEWYSTHKTREATFAILNILQEMDRMDAAVIVENAMKMAESVVEDEEFDYPEPPPIFISYQWAYQNEVKMLVHHLEMAGYNCWMDVGQMGGGDKLFEKIDQGIRAAKVVICCVTEKYAKSPNCKREVNLAVNIGKSLIPLLMENCSWPPPGSMGPIFSEYLFIRFFVRPHEETIDDRFWAAPKFQELLMQLSYNNIMPDQSKVVPEYKDWWLPVVEDVKITKRDHTRQPDSKQKINTEKEEQSPAVFISYQWGKQKQVLNLYKRLTEHGTPCWMDIYQMGGGDSLYDKIDKGVRGSKVILSCVTKKYTLSANCRREVSLADALKKPIIPLLLEDITWPPSGPMSMVFTQLLYVDFSHDVEQMWEGPEFDRLLSKINEYLPEIVSTTKTENGSGSIGRENQFSAIGLQEPKLKSSDIQDKVVLSDEWSGNQTTDDRNKLESTDRDQSTNLLESKPPEKPSVEISDVVEIRESQLTTQSQSESKYKVESSVSQSNKSKEKLSSSHQVKQERGNKEADNGRRVESEKMKIQQSAEDTRTNTQPHQIKNSESSKSKSCRIL